MTSNSHRKVWKLKAHGLLGDMCTYFVSVGFDKYPPSGSDKGKPSKKGAMGQKQQEEQQGSHTNNWVSFD